MKDYRVERIDKFGRNYPDKVILKSGETLIGQTAVSQYSPNGLTNILVFNIIEDIEDWKQNKIRYGTKKISIEEKDIEEISTYTDYQFLSLLVPNAISKVCH